MPSLQSLCLSKNSKMTSVNRSLMFEFLKTGKRAYVG